MSEIHTASSLRSAEEVGTWRGNAPLAKLPTPAGPGIQPHPYSDAEMARGPSKPSGGAPSEGYLVDWGTWHFRIRIRVGGNERSRPRREGWATRGYAPRPQP